MQSINEKISLRQLQALIIISAMGTGVIVLPKRVAEYAGSDGWMITIGLVIVAMIIGALISTAACLKPGEAFVKSTGHFLTRPVAYVLAVVLWLKLALTAGLELRVFLLIVQEVLLKHTPMFISAIAMLVASTYAAVKGIETRARVAEVLLGLMLLPFVVMAIIAVMDIDWSNLQPVLTTPPPTLLEGSLRLGFMFTGLECLLLVSPYIAKQKKMRRAVIISIGFSGIVIVCITVLTMAKFGRGVVDQPWPVLAMMDMLNLPGTFIERQEALMFSFWIITTFAFINALVFFGGVLIKDFIQSIMHKNNESHPSRANRKWQIGVLVTAVAVFAISCIPWDEAAIYHRLDLIYHTLGMFFLVILPVVLILASKLKPKRTLSLIVLATVSLSQLTACFDKIEIEDRAFVIAIGIDNAYEQSPESNNAEKSEEAAEEKSQDARFTVTISVATNDPSNKENDIAKSDEADESDPQHIKKTSAQTIAEALKKLDAQTDAQLYLGQAKLLVLGSGLLGDRDLLKSTLDAFNHHPEIELAIHVLAAHGKAEEILSAKPPNQALPGQYVAAIYKDRRKLGGTSFYMDLEKLITLLKYDDATLIPSLEATKNIIVPSGAALMADSQKVGSLTNDELRGYLWTVDSGGQGAVVTADIGSHVANAHSPVAAAKSSSPSAITAFESSSPSAITAIDSNCTSVNTVDKTADNKHIPFKVEKHSARIRFTENGESLKAHIYVELSGRFEETPPNNEKDAIRQLEMAVKDEILQTTNKIQNEISHDVFGWLEIMRKKQYSLYQCYGHRWQAMFPYIDVIPHVKIITN